MSIKTVRIITYFTLMLFGMGMFALIKGYFDPPTEKVKTLQEIKSQKFDVHKDTVTHTK